MSEITHEITVLVAALQESRYYALASASGVQESSFTSPLHGHFWAAMGECGWDKKVDIPGLLLRLKARGVENALAQSRTLLEQESYAWGSEVVTESIKALTGRRQTEGLKAILDEIRAMKADSKVDLLSQVALIQGRLGSLAGELSQSEGNAHNVTAASAVSAILDEIAVAPMGSQPGIRSRFEGINQMLGGYESGTVTVFAGRTSVGKTTLVCWEALKLTEAGMVVYFSLEMSAKQLATKLLGMLTGIDSDSIRKRDLTLEQRRRLVEAGNHPSFRRIKIIDASRAKPSYIRAVLARISSELEEKQPGTKLAAVIVDHLLLMGADSGRLGVRERVMECSGAMKSLAKEFSAPFLVLTQLNRSVEKPGESRKPSLVDLKESSSLEEDADVVILLNGERAKEELDLIIAKNREGQLGEVPLKFHKAAQTFTEVRSSSPFRTSEAMRQLAALEPILEGAFHKDGSDLLRFINQLEDDGTGKRDLTGQHTEGVLSGNRLVVTLERKRGEADWVKSYYCYCKGFQHDPEHRACSHIRMAHDLRNKALEAGAFRPLERAKAPTAAIDVRAESDFVTTAPVMAAKP